MADRELKPITESFIFHNHDDGSDGHSKERFHKIVEAAQRVLGIGVRLSGGIHYRDPAYPDKKFDIINSLYETTQRGLRPGIEFNIINGPNGWELDVPKNYLIELKRAYPGLVAVVSIHAVKAFGFTKEHDGEQAPEQTADAMLGSYLDIIDKYGNAVDVIGHPFSYVTTEVTKAHMTSLAKSCLAHDIALELNFAQAGMYELTNTGKTPHVRYRGNKPEEAIDVSDRVPILRHYDVIQEVGPLLTLGGDFHGNSQIEQLIKKQLEEGNVHIDLQVLKFIAALRWFLRNHEDPSRYVSLWLDEDIDSWVGRCL